jgi:hypothetical protein
MEYRLNLLKLTNDFYRLNFQVGQFNARALLGIEYVRSYQEYRISLAYFNFVISKTW